MSKAKVVHIAGKDEHGRVSSRILEERIQEAVRGGACRLEIEAFGQHGIGFGRTAHRFHGLRGHDH